MTIERALELLRRERIKDYALSLEEVAAKVIEELTKPCENGPDEFLWRTDSWTIEHGGAGKYRCPNNCTDGRVMIGGNE